VEQGAGLGRFEVAWLVLVVRADEVVTLWDYVVCRNVCQGCGREVPYAVFVQVCSAVLRFCSEHCRRLHVLRLQGTCLSSSGVSGVDTVTTCPSSISDWSDASDFGGVLL
jgi:hypothetical protein